MAETEKLHQEQKETKMCLDENPNVKDSDKLPTHDLLKVIRYKTIKKNTHLGWWSAVVLLEDHGKKQVCFYRWRKKGNEWKRDRKISFRSRQDWSVIKEAVESFLPELV
jgi:DNA/RNA endonuclease G (NUC1)